MVRNLLSFDLKPREGDTNGNRSTDTEVNKIYEKRENIFNGRIESGQG